MTVKTSASTSAVTVETPDTTPEPVETTTTTTTAATTTTTTTTTTTSATEDDLDTGTDGASDTDETVDTADDTGQPDISEPASPDETISTITSESPTTDVSPATSVTSTAATADVKHEPSPPIINKVSSDGKNVLSCDKGIIDYSNADLGYISVMYTGKKNKAKIRLTCDGKIYDFTVYPDGKYHYFTLSKGSGNYDILMAEELEGSKYANIITGSFSAKLSDDVSCYTYPTDYVNFDINSKCVALASELCGGCTTDVEKVAAVFKYVVDNISYDYELAATIKSFYVPDPDMTLQKKTGVCFDYSALMAAMLRSQGVPTRMIFGYVHVDTNDIYHAWNEVYTEKTGWVTLEVLFKNAGFNLLDSTFYSTSTDKKWAADLMGNRKNYSDVYIY